MRFRERIRAWFRARRADRQMPPVNGAWLAKPQPVALVLDLDTLPSWWVEAMWDAERWWNGQAGLTAVCCVAGGLQPMRQVFVRQAPPLVPAAATTEMHVRKGGRLLGGEIRLGAVQPGSLDFARKWRFRVCAHEIGHALGLGDNRRVVGAETRWGDEALLMTPRMGAMGLELLPGELAHVRAQFGGG